MSVNIMKLVVGAESLKDFAEWQANYKDVFEGKEINMVLTRYQPKQAEEILKSGGSIYRVIKGFICCRQKIVGFDHVETIQGKKCLILTDTKIIKTEFKPKKAFQGWRYLKEIDAPKDVGEYIYNKVEDANSDLEKELLELGLIRK